MHPLAPEQAPATKTQAAGSSGAISADDRFRSTMDDLGIVSEMRERRKAYARFIAPRQHEAAKIHRITVNCLTGERTVQSVEAQQVNPFERSARPSIVVPSVFRPDGVRRILSVVAEHWGVGVPAILGVGRSQNLARPRFAVMKLIRDRLELSTTAIGRTLGKRDHTTILSGLRRAERLHDNDRDWRRRYDAALAELETAGEP